MQLKPYINVHTHETAVSADVLAIGNRYKHFDAPISEGYCSMGLHPWYIDDLPGQMNALQQYSSSTQVLAIGECGLDTLCQTDPLLQEEAFRLQIEWANESGKPLIIHCVRAYSKALFLLKKAKVPVIFHGFDKKLSLAQDILRQGYYLSFGAALLHPAARIHAVLEAVPAEQFFLETDNATATIKEVYEAARQIRKTEKDMLILQLQNNFKKVFGI